MLLTNDSLAVIGVIFKICKFTVTCTITHCFCFFVYDKIIINHNKRTWNDLHAIVRQLWYRERKNTWNKTKQTTRNESINRATPKMKMKWCNHTQLIILFAFFFFFFSISFAIDASLHPNWTEHIFIEVRKIKSKTTDTAMKSI